MKESKVWWCAVSQLDSGTSGVDGIKGWRGIAGNLEP